jgi:peptidoglycan hydrolase-like protein with peptidoglycan-binding domain
LNLNVISFLSSFQKTNDSFSASSGPWEQFFRFRQHTRQGSHQQKGIDEGRQAEERLWELGYWAGPIDGKFDSASRQALIAFQKVEARMRTIGIEVSVYGS